MNSPNANLERPGRDHSNAELVGSEEAKIMRILIQRGNVSRVQIADLTGWSMARVYQRVRALLEKGLVEEIPKEPLGNRKNPKLFCIARNKGYLAGIVVKKGNLHLFLSDLSGEVLQERSQSFNIELGPEETLALASQLLSELLSNLQTPFMDQLLSIAVCVPGCIDLTNTRIVYSLLPHPGWLLFDIPKVLHEKFPSAIVMIESDVNIAALAEENLLSYAKINSLIYVYIGEDIRASIISQGEIHRGFDNCAGLIGHICVDKNGPLCSCGNTGCLNTFASESAIVLSARKAVGSKESSLVQQISFSDTDNRLEDIFRASMKGNQVALTILRAAGKQIGKVVAGLVNFFNPDHIVIGCDSSICDNRFLVSIQEAIYEYALPLAVANTAIRSSKMDKATDEAGVVHYMQENLFGKRSTTQIPND